jgi:hypothetical protein
MIILCLIDASARRARTELVDITGGAFVDQKTNYSHPVTELVSSLSATCQVPAELSFLTGSLKYSFALYDTNADCSQTDKGQATEVCQRFESTFVARLTRVIQAQARGPQQCTLYITQRHHTLRR